MTQRSAFVLRVRPDRIDDYVAAHGSVWPEMLDALRGAGIRNYTIFRHGNQVFGYFEADDLGRPGASWPSRTSRPLAGRDGRAPRGASPRRRPAGAPRGVQARLAHARAAHWGLTTRRASRGGGRGGRPCRGRTARAPA